MSDIDHLFTDETAKPRAGLNLTFGAEANPDKAAEAAKLARRYNLPPEVAATFQEDYAAKAKVEDATRIADQSPRLRSWLAKSETNAQVAHDDMPTLGSIEALMGSLGKGARYVFGADADRGLATDAVKAGRALVAGAPQFSAGAYGAAAYPFEAVGLDSVGQFLRREQRASQAQSDRLAGMDTGPGLVERGVLSGLRSAGQQLVTLPAGAANTARLTGEKLMLALMGLTTFGQSYGKARDQGAGVGPSAFLGLEDATAEVVTEKFWGAAGLLADSKAGMGAAKLFMRDILREVPGEVGATIWQNFNEWATLHPDKTVRDFIYEQPAALAETVIATIVGGGAQVGAIRATQKIMGDGDRQRAIAEQAERQAAAVEQLQKLATASKLNQRDAVTFKGLVAEIADEQGEAPTEFTIDPATLINTLNQSGITPEQLAEVAPTVAEQLRNPTGDIRIPVSEFLAAGEQVTAPLVDHLRVADDAMTRAEAREFLKAHGDQIKADVDTALQRNDNQAQRRQAIDAVRSEFEAELGRAGRFTPGVNKAYADLLANFYGATAERLGIAPQQLLEQYGLRVKSDMKADAPRTLEQGGENLDSVREIWDAAGISNNMHEADGLITLSRIVVPEASRGQGVGTNAMKLLTQYADRTGQRIALTPSADFGGNKKRLEAFYKRFGFKPNKGRSKDFTVSEAMVREPRGGTFNQSAIPAEQTTDENGLPVIRSKDIELAYAQPAERFEFVPAEGQQMYNLAIIEPGNWQPVGFVELVFEDGKVTGLYDIEVEQSARKGGIGAKVIEAILASNPDAQVLISNVVPAARGFWEQVGVPQQNVGEGDAYDGTLDWNTYAESPAGRKRGAARREAGGGQEAGGRGAGDVQGRTGEGSGGLLDQGQPDQVGPRAQIALPESFANSPAVIALFEGADLSSFIHESGHFFLEVQADLAARIQRKIDSGAEVTEGERSIVADMNRLLDWFGIKGREGATPLESWGEMSLDEKRASHEQFARGFEAYTREGKAPSMALQDVFQRFRSWLMQVYKKLTELNVTLTDDVRAVMNRMLASEYAIEEAEAARNMGPLFKSAEEAGKYGMSLEQYNALQSLGEQAKAAAMAELDARSLKDMKWLGRAKDKALKARQQEVEGLRREIRHEVSREVYAEPVYQAWAFLTGKKPMPVEESEELKAYRQAVKDRKERRDEHEDDARKSVRAEFLATSEEAKDLKGIQKGQFLMRNRRQIDLLVEQKMLDWDKAHPAPVRPEDETVDDPLSVAVRLNTEELRKAYGAGENAIWRKLSANRMTSDKGLIPDIVADMIPGGGFDSGDHLVKALAAAVPPQEVIDARTDQRMLEMFGDISSPEALQRAADEAVHNEMRARAIATEMKALAAASTVREDTGKKNANGQRLSVDALAKAAKEYADAIISRLKVREIRPSQYAAAEARSAKLAEKALAAGKVDEAGMHKRNQLVNNRAAKAAYDAREEIQSAQDYFRKFDKRSKTIDAGYLDQIDGLLERFDFKPTSLKEVDRRKAFSEWLADQREQGVEPNVPEQLIEEAGRKSYKDMTLEELRGLRDTVEQLEHLGRLKNKLLLARDQRDFDAVAEEMALSIIQHGGKARPVELEGPNKAVDWYEGVAAQHRKLASFFRQMDGNQDHGPMYERIGRAMNERGTMEDVMLEKATVELQKLYEPLLKMKGGITGYRSKLFIPEINASLTRGGRLAVALNWGNEANRQRLLDGDKWTEGQVRAIMRTLSPQELAFVNGVWEYLDTFWPEVAAKEKRLTGVEPEKVQAEPFNVIANDGTEVAMRGGYYPLAYDAERSDRSSQQEAAQVAKEMMQGAFTRSTTRRGHTKERLKEVKRPVRKDLNVITQHVNQVVHDLAWHEWLIDTNKLLGDERVSEAIRAHYGPKVLKTIRDGVQGIATADVAPQTDIDKALLLLRSNVTRATMGGSVTTAFLQPFGLTQSMVRIGPKHVLRGLARWGGDAAKMENTVSWIHEKSDFMRLRAKVFNRELREIRGSVQGKSKAMKVIDAGLFVMMQKMQMVADVPTWVGQYEKSQAEGLSEEDSVAMADRAVLEAQGGGNTKDLAEVQRKHPMLTQFYSYFNTTLNLAAESTAKTDFKNPAAVAGWLGDMALLMVIPAILPSLIVYALKGGDDDEEKLAKKIAEWQLGYLLGSVVGLRELTGLLGGQDYAGPPVGRLVGDIGKFGKQVWQGEVDEPAVIAAINLLGSSFGIPTVQAVRSYKGWKAWDEGQEGTSAASPLLGPPPKN